ncbi:unnamed protein product [Closterium sp. NIES-64]|nr:unnamed protein product [Closterium sp. NIES-64]
MAMSMDVLVARLEAAVARLEASLPSQSSTATSAPAASASAAASDHPSVVAFDAILTANLQKVTAAAEKVGSAEVTAATKALAEAFEAEKKIVAAIAACKKPDTSALPKLLEPLGAAMAAAGKLTEGKRTDAYNHVKAVAESVAALTWVAYSGKDCGMSLPGPHIDETWPAAEFYTNKILSTYRNTEGGEAHVEWARALKELYMVGLKEYIKKFHLTGPSWSASGLDLPAYLSSAPSAAPAPPRGGPPPPPRGAPPPPPPPAASAGGGGGGGGGADMSKVFSELNKGEAVTAGLRKVTADMKTKNRTDRSGAVPASIGGSKATSAGASAAAKPAVVKPPKFELQQGRKWVVENQVDNKEVVITDTEPKQTVYIFGCKGTVVQVKVKFLLLASAIFTHLLHPSPPISSTRLHTSAHVFMCSSAPASSLDPPVFHHTQSYTFCPPPPCPLYPMPLSPMPPLPHAPSPPCPLSPMPPLPHAPSPPCPLPPCPLSPVTPLPMPPVPHAMAPMRVPPGKVNNITLDKCTKTAVVFQDVLAACEVVNCSGVEIQCEGTAPTLAVDNTSGCQLYLAATALAAAITTAKSSEINVLVPGPDAETPWVEHALPEQFVSELKNGTFITTPISHSGG